MHDAHSERTSQDFKSGIDTTQYQTAAQMAAEFSNVIKKKSLTRDQDLVRDIIGSELPAIENWVYEAHKYFQENSKQTVSLNIASEWILDNFYIIRQAIHQINEDLTPGYYSELPFLFSNEIYGYPRIFAICSNLIAQQNLLFDQISLEANIISLQEQLFLTMGELWAIPIFLRYSLLAYLASALDRMIDSKTPHKLPPLIPLLPGINNPLVAENKEGGTENSNAIANIVLSLRSISEISWKDFFENTSLLEMTLRKDPAGVYPFMDFKTRDKYRGEIEKLANSSKYNELDLAQLLIQLSEAKNPSSTQSPIPQDASSSEKPIGMEPPLDYFESQPSKLHIGEFLFGKQRQFFETKIGYTPDRKSRLQRWLLNNATLVYLGSISVLTTLLLIGLALLAGLPQLFQGQLGLMVNPNWDIARKIIDTPWLWIITGLIGIAMTIPVLSIATSLMNWFITLIIPPRTLPKMDFRRNIPDSFQTMVVIPGLIASRSDVDSLLSQVEMHYLRNPQNGLFFAILTDFGDADSEIRPEDNDLIQRGLTLTSALNKKYSNVPILGQSFGEAEKIDRFYFFHRKRLWNPAEGKWMGWERKRGKLQELNQLLRGANNLSFITLTKRMQASLKALQKIRYIITLDADTILPLGAACRLVGCMAHPLNQPIFSTENGKVISGYTVLQPRMEIHPKSANQSWFTRIFTGDAGLDLYSLAVSDAYMDLFGEGIYVGKGIYDIDAFSRSVDTHIKENTILSHDLLEGNLGRAGLVTDITMVEDYPPSYLTQVLRQRRWIRGDWQLLPWLFKSNRNNLGFNIMDRWKIFDNLRRSLLAPSILFIFSTGLIFLPGLASLWTLILLLALAVPLLTGITRGAMQIMQGEPFANTLRPLGWTLLRWVMAISFLVYETYIAIDAILTTLYRLFISHKNLLQWTTAAQTARLFNVQKRRNIAWLKMTMSVLFAVILAFGVLLISNMAWVGKSPALIPASLVLLLWTLSPFIVFWINRPILEHEEPLNLDQIKLLRQIARRTWGFFEQFVGPEDHWLPPDHFQESPASMIAHRTSPTNIGLLLTSTLAAYDFGYLDHFGLVTRLSMTIENLSFLERYRGHFLNWYNTLTLEPLNPRYISTVDSGNMAACLIVTSQACAEIHKEPVFRWELWQGYLDLLANLSETLSSIRNPHFRTEIQKINNDIENLRIEILAARYQPETWYPLFMKVKNDFWQKLSTSLIGLLEINHNVFDQDKLAQLHESTKHLGLHQNAVQRSILELLPWIHLLENVPPKLTVEPFQEKLSELKNNLPYNLRLGEIETIVSKSLPLLDQLINIFVNDYHLSQSSLKLINSSKDDIENTPLTWLNSLRNEIVQAGNHVQNLLSEYANIKEKADQFQNEMEFGFLYDSQRRVFHIGFNLDAGLLDNNYYDLLASEARIASIVAISRREVPQSHWMYLSRPVTRLESMNVLLSWSGTMFEYLMPLLFLKSYHGTLLFDSAKGAVKHQIAYAKSHGVPWGISESGFYRFDTGQSYQYRAFGVPGLGFKRGLADDLVIAPYASLMAISQEPHAVVKNLKNLIHYKMIGLYGFYEALDFTPDRLVLNEEAAVVAEYMVHHQGMAMMALDNFFHDDIMVKRMHQDARIQSVELLLQEQVPPVSTTQQADNKELKIPQQMENTSILIQPWKIPIHTPIPQLHLLSNGNFNVVISNMGGGYSAWLGKSLTRWQPDGVLDPWGTWIYLQEMENRTNSESTLWSASYQPIPGDSADMQVTFHAHMAVFRRSFDKIVSEMQVTVASEDPVEIRRIHIQNNSNRKRHLRVTSYGEVILSPQAVDARHPAFNKLFIESEYVEDLNLQIFSRRPRSKDETPLLMAHMLISEDGISSHRHEADRNVFIGRGHTIQNPVALTSDLYLTGSSGATLDPIFALGREIELNAHSNFKLAYLTFIGESRDEILSIAQKYQQWTFIDRSFQLADIFSHSHFNKQGVNSKKLKEILQILSNLIYPSRNSRSAEEIISSNRLGQSGLWRFGVSGDFPILLVSIDDVHQTDLIREALIVYKYLRSRRYQIDLIILNEQHTNYGAELSGFIIRLIRNMNCEDFLNQRGGIYLLHSDQMDKNEKILIQTAARVVFKGSEGSLESQLGAYIKPIHHLPKFLPTSQSKKVIMADLSSYEEKLGGKIETVFNNGFGGFSTDGKEFVINYQPGKMTPAPWVNVIGYPQFGFMVSESGSQCTWSLNSGENRLTPWSNDPVRDPSGEILYLRDEETGEVWNPTPLPAGATQPYRIRHGSGYTIFEHYSHDLIQTLTLFASPTDAVKIIHLKLKNLKELTRRITATQYVEWVLGTTHAANASFIIPEYDNNSESLLAINPYNAEFGEQTAFLSASKPIHGMTADRTEFLGRAGSPGSPAGLSRIGLESRIKAGEDPCAVLQLHMDLAPGESEEIYFVLGQGKNRKEALQLVEKYHHVEQVAQTFQETKSFWEDILSTIQIDTPNPVMNLIQNRWVLYQTLSCRIWGRTAFYQSSGAFGFRDQLQDVLALLQVKPEIARQHLLLAAAHQFEEGDVLHWWHPPFSRGVRTRFSDDLLWLPYVVAEYVDVTGDNSILQEEIPFLKGPQLKDNEEEHYETFSYSDQKFSLMDHCLRAISKGSTQGIHNLPLIGTGDWNDGLNRVGEKGLGESIWLAWFLYDVLQRFARICESQGEMQTAQLFKQQAKDYAKAVEEFGWDGAWYRRAYYDNGKPLGSRENQEGQIDAIAQSWAVISGAGDPQRQQQAMNSVLERLVKPSDRLLLLLTPPFDKSTQNPGYIKGYLPGTRENGGQYTHAAIWTAWAFQKLKDGRQISQLYDLLNPILHANDHQKATTYRVEPYVIAADIYSQPPYVRRGGWTWYTGSAGWYYRLSIEAILGMTKCGESLSFNPIISSEWESYTIHYKYEKAVYTILVENPQHVESGIHQVELDGEILPDHIIPLSKTAGEHQVIVRMGSPE